MLSIVINPKKDKGVIKTQLNKLMIYFYLDI